MRNFESQLSAFGKHRYAQTTKHLRSAVNPRRRDRSLLWVTTPAAAVAGIIIGLGIQVNTNFKEQVTAHFEDTETKTIKQVVELPEYCCYDQQQAIELPEFEYIVKQL